MMVRLRLGDSRCWDTLNDSVPESLRRPKIADGMQETATSPRENILTPEEDASIQQINHHRVRGHEPFATTILLSPMPQ